MKPTCLQTRAKFGVALIGRRCPDNINLGLGYLAGALKDAGFRVRCHPLNDWRDMEATCREVLEGDPGLVGLSIPDGGSAFLPLGMGELLRTMGYRGHVTCGGQFATLARTWLLNRYRWLDSVVRFAGEVPLAALAERVQNDRPWNELPGVTTRGGDGPPHPVCDPGPMTTFPERDVFPTILGYPMTHIAATRGCLGTCSYCGPAALLSLERKEGRRAGLTPAELNRRCVGKVRRRTADHLCDEMAELYHRKSVRYFYFVDEHMLPYDEKEALEFIDRIRTGLSRRSVGALGLGTMLRADRITPRVAEAFARAGLARVFLGIEFAGQDEARRFGRRIDTDRVRSLLETFRRCNVAAVSNLMLVHPYSTEDTIENGIRFLGELPSGVFQATRMMVYHGTRLHERMEREQRLTGNPLRYAYTHPCPTVTGFAEIFQRLRGEAFSDYSIAFRSHDAALELALAARLHPKASLADLSQRLDQATRAVNRLHVRAFKAALDLARRGAGFDRCSGLVAETLAETRLLTAELDAIAAAIGERSRRPARLFAPMKAAAASALRFVVVGTAFTSALSGLAGCREPGHSQCPHPPRAAAAATRPAGPPATGTNQAHKSATRPGGKTAAGPANPDATGTAGKTAAGPANPDATGTAGKTAANPDATGTAGNTTAGPANPDATGTAGKTAAGPANPPATRAAPVPRPETPSTGTKPNLPLCGSAHERAEQKRVRQAVDSKDRCFSGRVDTDENGLFKVKVRFPGVYARTRSVSFQTRLKVCDNPAMRTLRKRKESAITGALPPRKTRCLWRSTDHATGKDQDHLVALKNALVHGCPRTFARFVVAINTDGTALPITPGGKKPAKNDAAARCIRKALKGLKFPCLAGHRICPVTEHVIIE